MSAPEMDGRRTGGAKSGPLISNSAFCGSEIPHCGTPVNESLNSVG